MMLDSDKIKLVVSDFDGIFTDRKLTVYSDGRTSKVVDYTDIMGIAVILKKHVNFAIISGETSAAIDAVASKFPSIKTFQNERNKIGVLKNLIKEYGIEAENVLYIGDDINDAECLGYVKYPYTVCDAHTSILNLPNINVTKNAGGKGAIREIADMLS